MNPLPKKKKSAEEIAKLREEMGLPPVEAPESTPPPIQAPAKSPVAPPPMPPAKQVRSLRRSERQPPPLPRAEPKESWASSLPAQRHSEDELEKVRQRESMQAMASKVPPTIAHFQAITAHPAMLALGYVLVIGGAIGFVATENYAQIKPEVYALAGSLTGLLVALYISLKKVRSRHHAGFIAMIALVVLVFTLFHHYNNFNPPNAS